MKHLKRLHCLLIAMVLGLSLTMVSCNDDDDSNSELTATHTIKDLKDLVEAGTYKNNAVEITTDISIKAVVISNQKESNNFYRTLYLQNGDMALKVSCDKDGDKFYELIEEGQEIVIKAKGLFIGKHYDNFVLGSGKDADYTVKLIGNDLLNKVVVLGEKNKHVTPKEIDDLSTLTKDMVGTLVKINNVQVVDGDKGKKLGNKDKQGYTSIYFTTKDRKSIEMSNNNYAKFNEEVITDKSGSVTGVLGSFSTKFRLAIRGVKDLALTADRFDLDPIPFDEVTVDELLEKFNDVTIYESVKKAGWYTEAIKGTEMFEGSDKGDGLCLSAAGFKASSDEIDTWIVSPNLNLDAANSRKNLHFKTARGYSKGETFEVKISTDFDPQKGIAAATWTDLPGTVTLAEAKASGYTDLVKSGIIDLSAMSGKVNVAFHYTGDKNTNTGTWLVDDFFFNFDPSILNEVIQPSYNFEAWTNGLPNGWKFMKNSGKTVTKVTDKKEGEYAMKVALDTREDFNITVTTENNKNYKVSFWYKIEGTPGTNGIKLWSKIGDEYAGATLKGNKLPVVTEWTKYEATFASAATDSFKFEVRGYNNDGLAFYIDDFKVEEVQ